MNLAEYTARIFRRSEGTQTERFFKQLGLPLPIEGEFSRTSDHGFLVFITPLALVVRITYNKDLEASDSRGLHAPLFSLKSDLIRIDLNAGMQCPVLHDEISSMRYAFKIAGVTFRDFNPQNAAYLPDADNTPVVIDPCSTQLSGDNIPSKYLSDLKSRADLNLRKKNRNSNFKGWVEKATHQDQAVFSDLRGMLRATWRHPSKSADQALVAAFQQQCRIDIKKGILVAGWDQNCEVQKDDYKSAKSSSAKYAERFKNISLNDHAAWSPFFGASSVKSAPVSAALSTLHIPTV